MVSVVMLCLSLLVVAVEMASVDWESGKTLQKRASVCFDKLGCFTTDGPFAKEVRGGFASLPKSPESIATKFSLYTRESQTVSQDINATHPETAATVWTRFGKRQTQFIVHGFLSNPGPNSWLNTMKDELLKHGDYNVIIVDWHGGNSLPYAQASANTRVVGAEIAELIKALIGSKGVAASDFHIIGHSLGSHVAGYAGERVPGLGRISGLDPAGLEFENTDKTVRLDPTDAIFVDAIHTDAVTIAELGFGMKQQVAHVDFYPNLGHDQPGCNHDISDGLGNLFTCNHMRATQLYIESINTQCPYAAFPCASANHFANNTCRTCTASGCLKMGFNLQKPKLGPDQQVTYYLTTAAKSPFCEYHLDFTVKLSPGKGTEQNGTFQALIHGTKGTTGLINLLPTSDPKVVEPGTTYTFYTGAPSEIGTMQSLTFTWKHDSSLASVIGHPTLYVDEIDVHYEEGNSDVKFCAGGKAVQAGTNLQIPTTC